MDENDTSIRDYLAVLIRRRWLIIIPLVVLFPLAATVAFLLPPVYRSEAKILIEDPDIPRELAVSTISSAADKRLQVINQRVMTSENLGRIIEAHDLYPNERNRMPIDQVVDKMRDHIDRELITVQSAGTAVAFTVSFEYQDPQLTQRVAQELVALYLNENVRDRQFRATETAAFFEGETQRLEKVIADIEAQLAELRRTQYGSLPEQLEFNQQLIARAEEEMRTLDRQEQTLRERRIYLQAELAQLAPSMAAPDEVKGLRVQLTSAMSRYGPEHPDVIRLRREIEALEKKGGLRSDPASLRKELAQTEADLVVARQRYTDSHPEVIRLSRQVDGLRASIAAAGADSGRSRAGETPDNPAYVQLQAQMQETQLELSALARQRDAIRKRIVDYEQRVEKTPGVQQTYQTLTRALEAAITEYRDIRGKQMAAQMGELLETKRKSERFSLLEPPTLPNKPIKPNRPKILLAGFVLSAGAGVALALLLEMWDTSVHGARELGRITGAPPLAIIPYIRTPAEIARAARLRAAFAVGFLALLTGAITFFHLYVMPLGGALHIIEQRLGTTLLSGGS